MGLLKGIQDQKDKTQGQDTPNGGVGRGGVRDFRQQPQQYGGRGGRPFQTPAQFQNKEGEMSPYGHSPGYNQNMYPKWGQTGMGRGAAWSTAVGPIVNLYVDKTNAYSSFQVTAGMVALTAKLQTLGMKGVELEENMVALSKHVRVNSIGLKREQQQQGGKLRCTWCGDNDSHTDGGCVEMQTMAITMPEKGFICQFTKKM